MSRTIKNGKFVDRTPEEEIELQRLKDSKSEYYDNVGRQSNSRPKKSEEAFSKITASQFEKLMPIKSGATVKLFIVLAYQAFKHWDKPFQMSTDSFVKNGFSRATQWRALAQLEKVRLIHVEWKPRQGPPIVTVL